MLYIMLSWKQNVSGLNSRNGRISLRDSHLGFYNFIYYTHLCRICVLVSIGELQHRHANRLFGRNLSLYFPIGV